ncbi:MULTISPECIES: ABC transporter permease [unclassified Oceanispirochaeta]|uniref:ABC transporter permease n=1 Tax=unclassified Oceanispirochaeta TaxID=2635722 RepID=UPI001314CE02|nr:MULTISPECIES: ABC transporter permease [unclassified Oceanispirochaeta]MBF9014024.1 ABC transporter permease [Oceanispirochaeta sp. M2]NPD70515.1 ABC transporter permease [Oceanispirochaeta sp. M1]
MRRNNPSLILGSLIILCLLVLILFPVSLTGKSPYTLQSMRSRIEQGVLEFESAPYPPSSDFPLGSDEFGRDLWSHIVYGARLTILLSLLIVLGRFFIALPMALSAGFGHSLPRSIIKQFSLLFSAIPALLISIIILKQDIFLSMDKVQSILAFVLVLSLVGWARLGNLMLERTEDIMKQPFIRTEIAMGKRRLRIAVENVIPHLLTEIIVLFFMEISAALSLLMQLGIFGVYVGNLRIIKSTDAGVIQAFNISFEPEWASMLGTARNMIYYAPWMVIFPALAFFFAVLGFNLLGEGFRSHLQGTESGRFSFFRILLNPSAFFAWLKERGKTLGKTAIGAVLFLILLIGFLFLSEGRFDAGRYDMSAFPMNEVIAGTPGAETSAALIAEEMKALGLEPLFSSSQNETDGYFLDYDIDPVSLPVSSECIFGSGNETLSLKIGSDYSFLALGSYSRKGPVYDASTDDLLNIKDFSSYDDVFVLIDKEYYSDESIQYITDQLGAHASPLGILLVNRYGESLSNSIARLESRYFIMLLSGETAAAVRQNPDFELSVIARAKNSEGSGRNIAGIKRGSDPDVADESVLINMGYNYNDSEGREILQFYMSLMDSLCREYESRRSFIFIFSDGTLSEQQNGLPHIMKRFPYNSSDIKVSIDLNRIKHTEFETLSFNGQQAPVTRYYAWSLSHLLEINMKKAGIRTSEIPTVYRGEFYFPDSAAANVMFWKKGIANIVMGTVAGERRKYELDDFGSLLVETIEMNNY